MNPFIRNCKSYIVSCIYTLPENPHMPSARIFAECRISSTRQSYYLPSAKKYALGEQLALGGLSLCRVPARWHSAKTHFAECQSVDTRQRASRAPHPPVDDHYGGGCFCLPSAYKGTLGKQIFAECPTVDTRQTLSRAPHTTVPKAVTPLPRTFPFFHGRYHYCLPSAS